MAWATWPDTDFTFALPYLTLPYNPTQVKFLGLTSKPTL